MYPKRFFHTGLLLFAALLFFSPGALPGFHGGATLSPNTYSSRHAGKNLAATQVLLEESDRDAPENREEDASKPIAVLLAFTSPGSGRPVLPRTLSNLPPGGKQEEPLSHFSRPPPFLQL